MNARKWPMLFGLLVSLAAVVAGFIAGADRVEDWQLAARWTARVGFPVFLLTYAASSLARLWPGPLTRSLGRNRRWWGLGFAASHSVHLVALVTFLMIVPESRTLASLIPGGFGYVVIYAMALTSSDGAMRALGRNWKRLHTFGIHTIWLIFTLAYAGRIGEAATRTEGVIATALAMSALILRLAARRRSRVLA